MDPIREIVINSLRLNNDKGTLGTSDADNVWSKMYAILAADGIAILAPASRAVRGGFPGYVLADHPLAVSIREALTNSVNEHAGYLQARREAYETADKVYTEVLQNLNTFSAAVKPPATPDGSLT